MDKTNYKMNLNNASSDAMDEESDLRSPAYKENESSASTKINLKAEAETLSLDSQVMSESDRAQQMRLLQATKERFYTFYQSLPNHQEIDPLFNEMKKNITFKVEELLTNKQLVDMFEKVIVKQHTTSKSSRKNWSEEQTLFLISLMAYYCHINNEDHTSMSETSWAAIASLFPGKKADAVRIRWISLLKVNLSKTPWTAQEDHVLTELLKAGIGSQAWRDIATEVNKHSNPSVIRTGKQCRERWANHLDPSINRGSWNDKQDLELLKVFVVTGKKWSEMAKLITNRTENAVKNRFNSLMKKFKADVMFSNLKHGLHSEEETVWEQRIALMVLRSKVANLPAEIEKIKAASANLANLEMQSSCDSQNVGSESEATGDRRSYKSDLNKITRKGRGRNKALSNGGSVNSLIGNHSRSNSNSSMDTELTSQNRFGNTQENTNDLYSNNMNGQRRVNSMSRIGSSELEIAKRKNYLKDIIQNEKTTNFTNLQHNAGKDSQGTDNLASLRNSNQPHGSLSPNSLGLHNHLRRTGQNGSENTSPRSEIPMTTLQQLHQLNIGTNPVGHSNTQFQNSFFNSLPTQLTSLPNSNLIGQNPMNLNNLYSRQPDQSLSQSYVQSQLNSMIYGQNGFQQNPHANLYSQLPMNMINGSNNIYPQNSQNILNSSNFGGGDKTSPSLLPKNSNNPFFKTFHQAGGLAAIKENVVEENPQALEEQKKMAIEKQQQKNEYQANDKIYQLKEKSVHELNIDSLLQKNPAKLFFAVVDLESNDMYLMNNVTKDLSQQCVFIGTKPMQQQQGRDPITASPMGMGTQLDTRSPILLQQLMEFENKARLNNDLTSMGLVQKKTEGSPLWGYLGMLGPKSTIGDSPDSLNNLRSPNLFGVTTLNRDNSNMLPPLWNISPGLRNEFSPNGLFSKFT